jgi:hypothetical protein
MISSNEISITPKISLLEIKDKTEREIRIFFHSWKWRNLTLNLKLFLKRDNLRGDLGEDGFELSSDLGFLVVVVIFGAVLQWKAGLPFVEGDSTVFVRQRRLGF